MRPLAQVNEAVVPVDGNDRRIVQSLDEFQLVWLVREQVLSLMPAQFLALEGKSARHCFPHQALDSLQVFWGEGAGNVEVVVEAVLGRGADAHLGLGEQLQHRVGHDVGRRVAHGVAVGVGFADVGVVEGAVVQHDSFLPVWKWVSNPL